MSTTLAPVTEGVLHLCIDENPHCRCRAIVVVPARNEDATLAATLDALRLQEAGDGAPLDYDAYEVLLLLNNCTDRSAAVARRYAADHPHFHLHILECELPDTRAHVGTARRALMDLACERLESLTQSDCRTLAILSTDADTLVREDWIVSNLEEMERGADAVGGRIELFADELDSLEPAVRLAYERDRELQSLVARLESLLDPDPADPWPRHLQHFGASLACTPEIYRRSGGLPPIKPLEDVAFVDALRKVGARLRHAPSVRISTSARLDGRAEVGLSGQLRHWQREAAAGQPHLVDSAEWMEHRFRALAALRRLNSRAACAGLLEYPENWRERLLQLHGQRLETAHFLERLDCDALIEEVFAARPDRPPRRSEITQVLSQLRETIRRLEAVPARPA